MAAAALPALKIGASLGAGLLGRKSAGAAGALTPDQKLASAGGTAAAGILSQQGGALSGFGMENLQPAAAYYRMLLGGSRTAQQQALQPEIRSITNQYGSASRGLETSTLRGAERARAQAELGRGRAEAVSSIVPTLRPGAADALSRMGQFGTQAGLGATGQAGDLYSQLLGRATQNRQIGLEDQRQSGMDMGGLIFRILNAGGWGKGGGGGGGVPVSPV